MWQRAGYNRHGRSWLFAFNHGTHPVTLRASGRDLITGREIAGPLDLPPDGVAVIRETASSPSVIADG